MSSPFLEIRQVSRVFKLRRQMFAAEAQTVRAVDNVSLSLERGQTLGLVGESGCGKSTLARMVVRLLEPSSGDILLDGQSVFHGEDAFLKALPGRMQMVFQDPVSSLNPRRSVGKSIQEALDIHNVGSSAERRATVEEMLSLVGLRAEHYARYPHEFSGGQRQRVAVARALIMRPELVVCDEPVSSLDVSVQAQVLNLLGELQKRFNLAYLFISHDLSVIGHISDRIAVMYLGSIVEEADADALFANPLHPYTRALLMAVPVPGPDARRQRQTLHGDLPSPLAPPSGCPFHPRCLEVMDRCRTVVPGWDMPEAGHRVSCHLHAK
ncbi:ABC transporter ATP-binding protein [Desulfovibrio subterraneus]|uniref:ABC transporter ATP-binding protein n=1 Tax=Desulfovibrio subterraneus TaxID=2718620 RepID=UPI00157A58B0|nr:dipeptide ABC transporter ATP-binding protein [Desulfovibrio subterraneus]